MKILKRVIDEHKIEQYCGMIYNNEPCVFTKAKTLPYILRCRDNSLFYPHDVDTNNISEEVFFDSALYLNRWVVSKLEEISANKN
jgi:hypothetical protein